MELKMTAKHTKLTESIKEKILAKYEKFSRLTDNIAQCEIVIKEDKQETFYVDLIMHVGHTDIIIKEHQGNLFKAIDDIFDKAERQLKKYKGKNSFTHEKMSEQLEV